MFIHEKNMCDPCIYVTMTIRLILQDATSCDITRTKALYQRKIAVLSSLNTLDVAWISQTLDSSAGVFL